MLSGRLTIRSRLLIALGAVGLVASGLTSVMAYRAARDALEAQAFAHLTAVRELKGAQVEGYFEQIANQVAVLAESPAVVNGLQSLSSAADELTERGSDSGVEQQLRRHYEQEFVPRLTTLTEVPPVTSLVPGTQVGRRLQQLYIVDNEFGIGQKHLLDDAGDGSAYSRAHAAVHPLLRNFLERFGYYDLFLIDRDGRVVYSVFKEVDFGTALVTGPHRDSNLAAVFRVVSEEGYPGFTQLVDFRPYLPSYGADASFIAAPVFGEGELIGALALQMPVDRVNAVMTSNEAWERVGLGASGEAYLVGEDFTLRSQSRFLIEDRVEYLRLIGQAGTPRAVVETIDRLGSAIGLQEVRTPGTEAALGGLAGVQVFEDYRGVPVLSAFRPLDIPGVHWALMSEIDRAEAFQPAYALRNRLAMMFAAFIAVGLLVALMVARALSGRIERLMRAAQRLADGILEQEVRSEGSDEIGQLARVLERMRVAIRQHLQRQEESIEALSTPLIPLHEEILIAPLVGVMDADRVAHLRETVTEGVVESTARVVIIDLTGVSEFRDDAAAELARMAKAVRLLGTRVVLTGISGKVALSIAELKISLEGVEIRRSLHHGIDRAMASLEDSATRPSHHRRTRR